MRATLLAAVLAACGGSSDTRLPDAPPAADADPTLDAAPPRETIMATQALQPGELVEGIMHGGPDDAALIHLEAPGSMDWNIHSHATGHAITVHEEYGTMTVDYDFTPNTDGDWYLLIRNSSNVNADIQVTVGLYGAMTWVWQ